MTMRHINFKKGLSKVIDLGFFMGLPIKSMVILQEPGKLRLNMNDIRHRFRYIFYEFIEYYLNCRNKMA